MPQRTLTFEERKFILKCYWKHENAQRVIDSWAKAFDTDPPSRQAIYHLRDKFEECGQISDLPRKHQATVNTENNQNLVAQSVVENPKLSTRRRSNELGISRRSLQRILHELKMKPYRPHLVYGLLEDDTDRRLQFCELFVNECHNNPEFMDLIIWSDEAQFKLSGGVNRHNCVYWDTVNPHNKLESQLNQPGITVWAGISSSGIVGPEFFEGTVNGQNYLDRLQTAIIPNLRNRPDFDRIFFMQDGAPPHFARAVRVYLDQCFPNRWIGRRGAIEYPPRSPDLTPMDFSVWGIIKDDVFSRRPRNIADLRQFITESFANLNRDLCSKICRSVASRCQECIDMNGEQFEHMR